MSDEVRILSLAHFVRVLFLCSFGGTPKGDGETPSLPVLLLAFWIGSGRYERKEGRGEGIDQETFPHAGMAIAVGE